MHAVLVTDAELASLNLPKDRPPPRIVIGVEGGLAQGYSTNAYGIDVQVLDYDEHNHRVSQPDGRENTAYAYDLSGSFDPKWVNGEIVLGGDDADEEED